MDGRAGIGALRDDRCGYLRTPVPKSTYTPTPLRERERERGIGIDALLGTGVRRYPQILFTPFDVCSYSLPRLALSYYRHRRRAALADP
jgi:hypothetical protein